MSMQTFIALSAAGLSALYFVRGALHDLAGGKSAPGGSCGKCSSGGCPVARKG